MALLREVHGAVKEHLSPIGFTRMNDIRLVQLGGPGDSSGEIARRYREANHLAPRRFLFLHDVPQALFEARKANKKLALVFLEDFSGSGTQIVDEAWGQMSQLIDVPYPPMVLALAVATHEGVEAIEAGTPLSVIAGNYLGANHRLGTAQQFTEQERRTIVSYCKAAGNFPLGYREGGLLLSFYFATPNNSISVLRGAKGQSPWRGVLPRSNDLY